MANKAPVAPEEVPAVPEQSDAKVLFRWSEILPGSQCAAGGTTVESGADVDANGTLDDAEVTQTSSSCHGTIHTEAVAGSQVLLRLDPEPIGTQCTYGGTKVRNGLDDNGNGVLEEDEVVQTQFVCSSVPPYPSNWAASSLYGIPSGTLPVGVWHPTGRKTTIFKVNSASRLKITVSDNFATGISTNGGQGTYEVRMNGGRMTPACYQAQYSWNASGWANNYQFPFSTVCLTDVLPAGLYEFDTWAQAHVGQAVVGNGVSQPLLLVEELQPTSNYGHSQTGAAFSTTSTSFQRASGRTVFFTKQSPGTLLKVTLADTLSVGYKQNGGLGTVMVRLDDVDTSCVTGKYDAQGTGGNLIHPFVMTCVLPNVSTGSHNLSVWARADSGGAIQLGWGRSAPLLMVEELINQNISYTTASGVSGEIGGAWSGVGGGRWLSHTVTSPEKTLRVTYSDTFRSALGCNGRWGYFQLYVDNQPVGCGNGQFAYNAEANQNHYHPINQVCLVKNLPPGPHTFSIWSTTRYDGDGTICGTNYFGWLRGQSLLMLEELP
ncbi:DUF7151 family protein [Archangium primigenium]|uniref:DUF7151 family protein n=1 Tax=[Archangium] primigenium TaxID=2792470 RepID=UPI0019563787|nr:hypothetical protein [Archangium primigenium]MBM7116177.1 hypothetical protein [Archangium primigenium]